MCLLFTGKSLTGIMIDLPISYFIHHQMLRAIALQRWGEVDIQHRTQSEKTLPEECAGYINRKGNTGRERRSAFPQVIRQVLDKARNRVLASWAPSIPQHTWSPTWLGCRHRSRVETPLQTLVQLENRAAATSQERHLYSFQELKFQQKLCQEVLHSNDGILIFFTPNPLSILFWIAFKGVVLHYKLIVSPPT